MSRRADTNFDIVMQAGTNDLNKPSVSPPSLIGKLKEHVNDIKSFSNVFKIFLCKVPPRSDKHRVNSKISHFNNLLVDELSNADNVIIVETIPLEAKLFHTDNLHFNDEGLRQISGIILSVLYKVIAQICTGLSVTTCHLNLTVPSIVQPPALFGMLEC